MGEETGRGVQRTVPPCRVQRSCHAAGWVQGALQVDEWRLRLGGPGALRQAAALTRQLVLMLIPAGSSPPGSCRSWGHRLQTRA